MLFDLYVAEENKFNSIIQIQNSHNLQMSWAKTGIINILISKYCRENNISLII